MRRRRVEMVGIVRQQEMGVPWRAATAVIRPAHDEVVDAAEHELAAAVGQLHRLVLEHRQPDALEAPAQVLGIAPQVVVVAEANQAPSGARASGVSASRNGSISLTWP